MNRRPALALGLAAFGVVFASIVLLNLSAEPQAATSDDGAERFEVGRTDVWQVEWTTSASAALPIGDQAPFDVSSALVGTWSVTTVAVDETTVVQRAALVAVDSLVVLASGEPLDVPSESVRDVPVTLTRSLDGALVDITFAESAHAAARNTLTGLSRLFSVSATDGERYATYGVAEDTWQGNERTTSRFVSLTGVPVDAAVSGHGTATLAFGDGGRLVTMNAQDDAASTKDGRTLLNTSDTVAFRWLGVESTPVTAPAHTVWSSSSSQTQQAGWAARAHDFPADRVLAAVRTYDGGDAAALMWGGTARLAVDAAARQAVADVASSVGTDHSRRELALDLLAHTPDGRAEAELLGALQSPVVQAAPEYGAYVQRLGFVQGPSQQSVELLHALVADTDVELARAARLTLGAVARKTDTVDGALRPLRGRLPDNADDAASVIAGLGNAGQSADIPVLVAASADPRPKVRASAIHGLRHFEDPVAMPVIRETLADVHPGVQRAALTALGQREADAQALEALAQSASQGQIDGANLGVLATALAGVAREPHARAALVMAMDHDTADATFRARVRAMLAE